MTDLVLLGEEGIAVTNSLLVAEKFGKMHKNVIQSIKNIIHSAEKSAQFYKSSSYIDSSGRENQMYIMNRDGFTLLVMGFNGKQAMDFKIEFIDAFNKMENLIKEKVKPQSALELFELALNSIKENQIELKEIKKEVEQLKVKTATKPDYFTIVGYASLNGIPLTYKQASAIGKKASKMCKRMGVMTDSTPDPRFGRVRMYPSHVLDEIFNSPIDDGCGF